MTVEKLLERGEAAMLVRNWEVLLDCARRLQMARHPQGYTFQAFAQRSQGQLDAAIETLRKGVRQLPREMELRHELVETLFQAQRYAEVLDAVDECLQLPFIRAIDILTLTGQKVRALMSLQRYEDALQVIDQTLPRVEPELEELPIALLKPMRASVQIEMRDFEGARETIHNMETLIQQYPDLKWMLQHQIYTLRAQILYEEKGDAENARRLAREALNLRRVHPPALALLYKLSPPVEGTVYTYQVGVESMVPEPETGDFAPRVTIYTVVARSEEEAKQLALAYETDADERSIGVFLCEQVGESQNAPVGVLDAYEEFVDDLEEEE